MNSGIKRLTSLCLALIMVFGLTFMPVYADDSNEMGMSIVFTDTSYEPISFAREGQTIYVGVKIDNYQPLCAYSWRFDYDPELMSFNESYNYSQDIMPGMSIKHFENGVYKLSSLSPSTTNIKDGVAIANFAKETNIDELIGGIAFYLAFTVKKAGQITAQFNREAIGNFTWRTASVDSSSNYTDIDTAETNGTLNVVSTGVSLSQYEVTVDGLKGASVNATAFDASVNDITSSVTWSVEPQNGGVSISGGTITVDAKAKAGNYTITATGGEGIFGEGINTASATLTVKRNASVAESISVSGGSSSIDVPGNDQANATATFTATVTDQYGVVMTNPDVAWSIDPKVDGISIAGGVLTVTNAAKTSIDTTGKTLTVTATCDGKSDTAEITVKRAASTHSSIEILKGDKAITSDNIAAGETGNYTAKYYDQYGYQMDPPAEVTPNWEISNFNECDVGDFSLSPSGEHGTEVAVSVKDDVKNGASATLTVSENNLSDSITINVNALTFTAEPGAVTFYYPEGEKAVYGPTWEELVQIDQDKITATYNGEKVKGTYYLKVSEDYGSTFNVVDQKARPVCDSSIALYMCSIYFDSEDETFKDIYVAKHCTSSTNVPDISFSLYPKPVTVSGITATDKVYDGTTVATIDCTYATVNEADIVDGDKVTIDATNATGTFDTKDVGTGKTVTIAGLTLSGEDAANYKLSTPVTTTGNITKRPVTVSVDGVSVTKVYDGTTAASTSNISGQVTLGDVISEDNVDVSVVTVGDYSSAAVGTNYEVTLNLQLTGEDATNYTLPAAPVTATASITASSNITDTTAAAQNVVVGVGTFTEPKFTGIGGEAVTGTVTYSYGDETDYNHDYAYIVNALKSLSKGQTATIGYSFTPTDSNYTGTITGTITVTMVDIVFTVDGEPATADNAVTIKDNPTYGDTWSEIVTIKEDDIVATLSGETLYGGTYSLNVSDMPDAGGQDYTVRYTYEGKTYDVCSGTVTVARRALTITGIGAEDKEYNGTTAATVTGTATLKGLVGTDTFTVSNGTAAFASKDAGTQTVTFTGFSITGEGADNYTLTQPDSVTATISPKSVTIENVAVSDKTYDGNRDATIANSGTISGIISSDNVTIQSGTGTFASADVGTGITVTFSSFSLSGDDAGNYTLSAQPASTTADITKANYTGTPNTVNVNVLINQSAAQTGSVSIDQFFQTIPAGAVITSVAPASGSVMDSVAVEDGVIKYSSKANLETENVTDTYTVTIATQNYNNITATLTFTTVAKTPVNISGVSVTGAGKTYDGKAVSYTGTPAAKTNDGTTVAVTGTYSYVWQKADGTVLASAPKDAGIYKLVITLDDPAYIGSAEVSFTIAKAKITITAEDAEAYTGSDMPKLSYTVTGLATGEKLAKEPSVSCAADMKKAGSYVIAVSGAEVPNTNNYEETITYVSGTLEVKNRPVNIGPTYDIKVLDSAHGTVRASLGNASEGSTIRLTVTPDEGYSLANLIVRDERGRRIDVAKSGGVYRFVMPAGDVTIEAVFAQGTTVLPFTDVSTYDWFYEYVKYVYDNGIMDGIDVGVFGPGITTTRAMLVTMLYRVAGEPYVSGTNDFADVAANTWYTDAVTWASKNGIVTGVDVGVFNPNGAITREQLATILYRYAEYVGEDVSARASLSRFTDTGSISAYARDAMSWAVAEGILDGRTATELAPTGECTRAEVATMIARAFG